MPPAAKHLDPVLGADVHVVLVAAVPTPVPVPFVGMVFDPIDYLPVIGSNVLVNGMKRASAGTAVMAMPCHIPLPYVKPPANEGEMFMGSSTVEVEGEPMSYAGNPALTCHDIGIPPPPRQTKKRVPKSLFMPTSFVMPIPSGPLVMIGGAPTISLLGLAFKALGPLLKRLGKTLKKSQKLAKVANKVDGKLSAMSHYLHTKAGKALTRVGVSETSKVRNVVHRSICAVTGHPVDICTGKVFTEFTDLTLQGPFPFALERVWFSTSTYDGPLGHGWYSNIDLALAEDDELIAIRLADGRGAVFPRLRVGESHFDLRERLTLKRSTMGYALNDARAGLTHHFAQVRSRTELPLIAVEDRNGHLLQLRHDGAGRLDQLIDAGGRIWRFRYDDRSHRISALVGPHPQEESEATYLRFRYDGYGNLAEVRDALDQPQRFGYKRHLLVRETNRNGLTFSFEYDGHDERARCTRTWGDGGIYDHKLRYDLERKITTVENSLGHKTLYEHDGAMVHRTTDSLGGRRSTKYGPGYLVLEEVNELGHTTSYDYDERGNLTAITRPDDSSVTLHYDASDLPVRVVDAIGGVWQWSRDERGRVLTQTDPLERTTRYLYSSRWLTGIVDAAGTQTTLSYSREGNLNAIAGDSTGVTRLLHDRLGRLTATQDALSNVRRVRLDLLGRPVEHHESDGNVRRMTYDAEGNVVRAVDAQHDVSFCYRGMNRLASRSEAGTTVRFEYDTEEQLTSIVNEHGKAYRFVLGPTGKVLEEHGFDGLLRRYTRDVAGQVLRVDRPAARFTAYELDQVGRVIAVAHSDGSCERYSFRLDGALVEAENDATTVSFERDLLGRVTKELVGEHWVESTYDLRGARVRTRSSLGADVTVARNDAGHVEGVLETGSGFEARFRRDQLGRELERSLPGGLRSRWKRDALGRPIEHEVEGRRSVLRAAGYHWEHNDRLRAITDGFHGRVEFRHDALGNLAWASYPDGTSELRLPDAVGNLFRSESRTDRRYGPAGQLLASRGPEGITEYSYDPEGNLVEKREPNGSRWIYHWNGAGMLAHVTRPDGTVVSFAYDALGRRIEKRYRGQTTRWVWDGNVMLHEWVEGELLPLMEAETKPWLPLTAQIQKREAELSLLLAQGPPVRGSKAEPITWLFEPESFAPMARLQGGEQQAIVCDHLGTPVLMVDGKRAEGWSGKLGVYGELRAHSGLTRWAVPFRFPGQYEDAETGLYYNRFRYYDPEAGQYASQDPIRLCGGSALYAYACDPLACVDFFGLNPSAIALGMFDVPLDFVHPGTGVVMKGLKKKEELIRFADARGAAWYREFDGIGTDVPAAVRAAMNDATQIHVNLDGLGYGGGPSVEDIMRNPDPSRFHPGSTNWELATILSNPELKQKTTFWESRNVPSTRCP